MNARPQRYRCQINLSDKVSFSIIAGFPTLKRDFGGDMVNACCQKRSLTRCQIYIAKGHRAQRPFKLMLSGGEEKPLHTSNQNDYYFRRKTQTNDFLMTSREW